MVDDRPELPTRRGYLRSLGWVLATVGVAGCGGDGQVLGTTDRHPSPAPTTRDTPTVGPTTGSRATTDVETTAPTQTPTSPDATDRTSHAPATTTPLHASYATTEVRVETSAGDLLGSVTAAIADTPPLRYTGLSDTPSLPDDRGMLFVFEGVAERTFVMREMAFGLDIVFADAAGTITRVHHAPVPGPGEDGSEQTYPGRGQYVLEVRYGWTTARGVSLGDRLVFDLAGE